MDGPTIPTPNAPKNDWKLIPDVKELDLSNIPEEHHLAIRSIASATRLSRGWMGVSTWFTCASVRATAGPGGPKRTPENDFLAASREGWIQIIGDYAHPTQKLADRIAPRR